jgi:N-methylhydantoinase A
MAWQIGVDVGGTFTDLLALDPERGGFRVAKVPSSPEDQSVGFIAGLAVLETDLAAVAALVHGTTVATNAVLERKGARCGLITTAGFRDVLELGRRTRPNPYGMTGSFEALIPHDLRAEVPERIDAAGRVLTPLDEAAVRQEVHRLRERGAEALVIYFIHAYANPAHEQRCGEIAREIWPNRFETLGSDILRKVREFERGSTAALNGYVQPIVSRRSSSSRPYSWTIASVITVPSRVMRSPSHLGTRPPWSGRSALPARCAIRVHLSLGPLVLCRAGARSQPRRQREAARRRRPQAFHQNWRQ